MPDIVAGYEEFETTELQGDLLQRLSDAAKLQFDRAAAVAQAEKALKDAEEAYRQVSEDLLPKLMEEARQQSGLTTSNGLVINVEKKIRASIPKAAEERAFKWLEATGNGGLIKHEIKILFPRDEEAWAKKFLRDLAQRKRPVDFKRKDFVEPSTLTSFVKRSIEAGVDIPKDAFGVFEQKFATVKLAEKAPAVSDGETIR